MNVTDELLTIAAQIVSENDKKAFDDLLSNQSKAQRNTIWTMLEQNAIADRLQYLNVYSHRYIPSALSNSEYGQLSLFVRRTIYAASIQIAVGQSVKVRTTCTTTAKHVDEQADMIRGFELAGFALRFTGNDAARGGFAGNYLVARRIK